MSSLLCGVLCLLAAGPELQPKLAPAVQLHYQGTVAQVERDSSARTASKQFDLTLLITSYSPDATDYYWLLDERGQGNFSWTEHFGRWSQNTEGAVGDRQGPALLYDYGDGKHVISLSAPRFLLADGAEVGTKWTKADIDYEVAKAQAIEGRATWVVESRNQFGPISRMWVDQATQLILQQEERVFMNQGTEYRLALKLADVEVADEAEFRKRSDAYAALVALRGKLKRPARTTDEQLTAEQLKLLEANLPAAKSAVDDGALARIVGSAERDLKQQTGRNQALDEIIAKQLGRKVESFRLSGLDGAALADTDLDDKVTVLHFWDYRDEPLKEPYGQVGYLEFLYAKHREAGLRVAGIAVDGRFQQPATTKLAAASVRKLKNFMNLSYPIVFDGGDLIRQFGDPRLVGGHLPLFVVIGPDGKIVHYKVGHYALDRDAGLKELDAAVRKLLKPEDSK
ncbi:MAG: TlpA family protein disulfide reductase [Planctomycetia bacterium]|nr:TlpA family protein disulfide reductase [Planctomycetia bacterium]